MWPWGHAAVGYLLYAGWTRSRRQRPPTGPAVLALLVGTQLPDLVDKPLAWTFGVLPAGRSLAHSLLVAALVLAAARWLAADRHRDVAAGLAVGWVSHSLVDVFPSLVAGEVTALAPLAWPLVPAPAYETEPSFLAHVAAIEPTPYFLAQVGLAVVTLATWNRDGRPGVETVRALPGSITRTLG